MTARPILTERTIAAVYVKTDGCYEEWAHETRANAAREAIAAAIRARAAKEPTRG